MRQTLLLADDSLTVRRVIEQTFADEPIDVVTVGDGTAALVRLGGNPPDVLLADIGMPAPDGYELALHVRRTPALAHIPVILLTGAFDPVDHARARDAGCAGVLVKPFDPQMLIARVRQLLQARRPAGGPVVDDGGVRIAGTDEASPSAVPPPVTEPPTLPPATAVSRDARLSAATRAAEIDDYFVRLDRAFATLQTASEGNQRRDQFASPTHPRAAGPINSDIDSPRGAEWPTEPSAGTEAEVVTEVVSAQPAATEHARPVTPGDVTRRGTGERRIAPHPPTLAGAFAALLALEQGHPLPPAANGWTAALSTEVLDQIVRRVTQEIAEAVVRELAPAIVSEVAERLVREETARLRPTSGSADN